MTNSKWYMNGKLWSLKSILKNILSIWCFLLSSSHSFDLDRGDTAEILGSGTLLSWYTSHPHYKSCIHSFKLQRASAFWMSFSEPLVSVSRAVMGLDCAGRQVSHPNSCEGGLLWWCLISASDNLKAHKITQDTKIACWTMLVLLLVLDKLWTAGRLQKLLIQKLVFLDPVLGVG